MKQMVKQKKKTLSVDLDLINCMELQILLKDHEGYVDGDDRTLELYVIKK